MPSDEKPKRDLVQEAGDHAAETSEAIKGLKFGGRNGISIFADFKVQADRTAAKR
jgi:hypothetical protein